MNHSIWFARGFTCRINGHKPPEWPAEGAFFKRDPERYEVFKHGWEWVHAIYCVHSNVPLEEVRWVEKALYRLANEDRVVAKGQPKGWVGEKLVVDEARGGAGVEKSV